MKKIIRKNQIIITSLAALIAVAGYLNFAEIRIPSDETEASAEVEQILDDVTYDLTDEIAMFEENGMEQGESEDVSSPGEAVLTSSLHFAAQAKLSREQIRSQNKAELKEIIENQELLEEQKTEAIQTMVEMTQLTEKEAAAELLLEAKGFENVIVNLTGETADVVVPRGELDEAKRAQIEDIVKRKTGIAVENIVITPLQEDGGIDE